MTCRGRDGIDNNNNDDIITDEGQSMMRNIENLSLQVAFVTNQKRLKKDTKNLPALVGRYSGWLNLSFNTNTEQATPNTNTESW